MGMKIDLCNYSGYKCYPSRGITYVKADGKTFRFLDGRSKKAHMLKRNPRKVTWTVLYRRKHRKGVEEETTKKDQEDPQVPEGHRWCFPQRNSRQEEPKARAKEGTA